MLNYLSGMATGLALSLLLSLPFARLCPTEDSSFCTWRADVQGNGLGRSFTDLGLFTVTISHK